MRRFFSAPTTINLELTDVCNVKCVHCYNPTQELLQKKSWMTKEKLSILAEMFSDAGVFHVVLTGGEPFSRFDLLEHGIKVMGEAGLSVSCNSNLMLVTEDKIKRLADLGLDHILTSLTSYDPETNDRLVAQKGAFYKIISGIKTTVNSGIRVSVNMVVSKSNIHHVYDTGKFVYSLGCQKIFGTRNVPAPWYKGDEFKMYKEEALYVLDQLIRVKNETGIMIGSLVSYPLCLLGDLEKYGDFVGRGCPAQAGHRMGINAHGNTHACVHEADGYGDIFKEGIHSVYEKMRKWHDESYRYKECSACDYKEVCHSGCRMSAQAYFGSMNAKDPLWQGKDSFVKPYKIVYDDNFFKKIGEREIKFYVPKRLRFRKESDFYLLNIRWGNTITISNEVAKFLLTYKATEQPFTVNDFGKNKTMELANLYFKDAIESPDLSYSDLRSMKGVSIDPSNLLAVQVGH